MRAGQVGGVVLETGAKAESRKLDAQDVLDMFNRTVRFWRDWVGKSSYTVGGVRSSTARR